MKLDAFAITVYRQPEVADACLTLQESMGLDVPILLYCAWFGCFYGEMKEAVLFQAIEVSTSYANSVVKPLRHTRRWMKDATQSRSGLLTADNLSSWQILREQIKAIEISSELLWLKALETMTEQHLFTQHSDFKIENILANMRRYCQTFRNSGELDGQSVTLCLSRIADACTPAHKA
jgi:uncharacterized protein (TIGR02444 family)